MLNTEMKRKGGYYYLHTFVGGQLMMAREYERQYVFHAIMSLKTDLALTPNIKDAYRFPTYDDIRRISKNGEVLIALSDDVFIPVTGPEEPDFY